MRQGVSKDYLIAKASEMGGDNEMSLLISSYQDQGDQEVAAILIAWLSNGNPHDDDFIKTFISDLVRTPKEFVVEYRDTNAYAQCGDKPFWGLLTYAHLHALLCRIAEILEVRGSVREEFVARMARKRYKYAHEVFFDMFGGECGFPSLKSNGTFYRYNLLAYFLAYNPCVWGEGVITNALIPCDNHVIANANALRLTRRRLHSNTRSAAMLTKDAKEYFGEKEFYKMYELLK